MKGSRDGRLIISNLDILANLARDSDQVKDQLATLEGDRALAILPVFFGEVQPFLNTYVLENVKYYKKEII